MIQNNCSTPQTSSDYIKMVATPEQAKQFLKDIRGILPMKKKMPHGWPACLKRTPPNVAFRNNDVYNMQKAEEEHHYEEPQEPQEKSNMRVFYKLQINDQNNELCNMQQEDEDNENYESVEERETTI